MGRKYSGRRPEDKPMYVRPDQLDYEKRALLVTSFPATTINVIQDAIEDYEEEYGMILDGGESVISYADGMAIVIDGGLSA